MSERNVSVSTGPIFGLATLVFIVFLVLKLAKVGAVASWSWWWVTSPLWISAGLTLGLVVLFFAFAILVAIGKALFSR